MKVKYRNCEIEVTREKCLAGYDMIFYNIFTEDGFEVTSSFSESEDTIQTFIKNCKLIVDDWIVNPQDYE